MLFDQHRGRNDKYRPDGGNDSGAAVKAEPMNGEKGGNRSMQTWEIVERIVARIHVLDHAGKQIGAGQNRANHLGLKKEIEKVADEKRRNHRQGSGMKHLCSEQVEIQ